MGNIKNCIWGAKDGKDIFLFTLENSCSTKIQITNFGGIIVSAFVHDRNGNLGDIILGFDALENYLKGHPFFGALVGRNANRINRGRIKIGDKQYQLAINDETNHLHGGLEGFDEKVWNPEIVSSEDGECLELSYFSRDGEENYPGNLDVRVRYSLSEDNSLKISYYAQSDADTIVNLTNHAYFNLSGQGVGDILRHEVMIYASNFTPVNGALIPTGELRNVKGTPMDFTKPYPVGQRINDRDEQLDFGGGYDHNWVLDKCGVFTEKAAEVYDPASGRVMEVYTTKPGIQFYTGNFLASVKGKGNAEYGKRGGFCLETQYYPDSINQPCFPSPILKAGDKYNHTTVYKFSSRK